MIIVTGAAGFIGSNIVKRLNSKGKNNILLVDNLSNPEKHLNLNSLHFRDYIDKHSFLDKLNSFDNIEAIFHQGACSSTTERNGLYMMNNNYNYSKTLLDFSVEREIPFFYASSASVYGKGEYGFIEERKYEYPLNIYAFSKTIFDRYVTYTMSKYNTQIVGLRYFNVYGPQENHKLNMASLAFNLFNQLQKTGEMKLFEGSENFLRDFIHIDDVVNVNMYFYESKVSGIFNCGTGISQSFYRIAEILKDINGSGNIKYINFPKELVGKYQQFTQANLSKLRDAGYNQEFISLREGISSYYSILEKYNGYYVV